MALIAWLMTPNDYCTFRRWIPLVVDDSQHLSDSPPVNHFDDFQKLPMKKLNATHQAPRKAQLDFAGSLEFSTDSSVTGSMVGLFTAPVTASTIAPGRPTCGHRVHW